MDCTKIKIGLRKGAVPEDSRNLELQIKLSQKCGKKNKIYYTGKKDAIFGPMTDTAVRNYQRDNGLVIDGIGGPITLKHLGLCDTPKPVVPAPTPNKNISTTKKTKNQLNVYVFNQKTVPGYEELCCGPVSVCMALSHFDIVTPANFQQKVKDLIKAAGTNKNGTVPENLDKAVNKVFPQIKMVSEPYKNMNQ